jgi:hypothetical protein
VAHSFLIEPGIWKIQGHWLERNKSPVTLQGNATISWHQESWFATVFKMALARDLEREITSEYRGRLHYREQHYNYVLQHSVLGKVEGEGWIGPRTITQRYWVLNDGQRRSGFENFYQMDNRTYHFTSGILAGQYLSSTMEAIFERQN